MSFFNIFGKKKEKPENIISRINVKKELWEAFKEQYRKEHFRILTDEEALAIALFENAILNTQNFITRLSIESRSLDSDTKSELSEDFFSYSLSMIFIYMSRNHEYDTIRTLILNEYEKFIKSNSDMVDPQTYHEYYQLELDKLNHNIIWLSTPFDKLSIIEKILTGISYFTALRYHKPILEKFIDDVELSIKHFGIV
ncbi:MAG: hypothetical protein KGZ86_00745 [Candidatus Latescibacteria bacterium]|nr:hypothetical protein [Candidatus Latescibacterota bacterium]